MGFFFTARIADTLDGKEVMELIRAGALNSVSVGFDVIDVDVGADGIRHVTKAKLWEISVVTWGADSKAKITEVNADESSYESNLSPKYLKRELQISRIKGRQAKTLATMLERKLERATLDRWESELEQAERMYRVSSWR